jgi:hypothetical protein
MNTIQTALSSARFNRYMLWFGMLVLAAGALVLVFKFAGGSDPRSDSPDKGFKAQLPERSVALKNAQGVTVKTFYQLDPAMRATIRKFIGTAVMRQHLDQSWEVIAPSMKTGYTRTQWLNSNGTLPIVPYPVANLDKVNYYLDYASTKGVLVEVGLNPKVSAHIRPTTFQIELVPVQQGQHTRWLVDYWMPRWTPPLPEN